MNLDQLLFSELRLVSVVISGKASLSDEALTKALTINEELLSLGYTLSPKDIITLAGSDSMEGFVQRVRDYIGDVKAEPMYPGFPEQVMAMDEAVFRFHQMLHYLSTYGVELFTGEKVSKGWLPESQKTQKIKEDAKLLEAKVIALIDEKDKFLVPYRKILTRTERMDDKQRLIIKECITFLSCDEIAGVKVTFKQNLLDVFNTVFTSSLSSEDRLSLLHAVCQHTGDVWKCMDYALTRAGFHFRTSQKRLIVKLLESYPLADFKANLILSNKKGERTSLMLKYIDFNEYSRKKEYKEAVAAFRSGELRSWESRAKFLVKNKSPEALAYYAERPGMMLRSLTFLLRNGCKADDVYKALLPKAHELKTQTLVSLMNFFSRPGAASLDDKRYNETLVLNIMIMSLLTRRLSVNKTALAGKRVYIDMPEFDLDQSVVRINDKSLEGGYIRSGLAYKIPENVDRLRFFVYWNDKNRVDVDLHASAKAVNGTPIHIGWNTNYKDKALVFSGDITHSDAAEYIDIDLVRGKNEIDCVGVNINLFSGYSTFGEIDECFVGAMAVKETGEEVKLYDPKNCFFTHFLTGKYCTVNYGYVDVQNRVIVFDGVMTGGYYTQMERDNGFSLSSYIDILLDSQRAVRTDSPDDSDLSLVMGKPVKEGEISLIDNNFFMEQT